MTKKDPTKPIILNRKKTTPTPTHTPTPSANTPGAIHLKVKERENSNNNNKTKVKEKSKEKHKDRAKNSNSEKAKAQKKTSPILKTKKDSEDKEKKKKEIQKIDNLVSASASIGRFTPMLAATYDGSQNIDNWYMSEKLDGVRCIWDGKHLFSRNNNLFNPPRYFIENFPKDTKLDGELFTSRQNFSQTVSIVKKADQHDGWKQIKYIIFDGPDLNGTFKQRLEKLKEIIDKAKSPYLTLHHHRILSNKDVLEKKMDEIVKLGGEGLIVRDPKGRYENKRSKTMLKVKRFHDDEATVLKHIKGTGRNENVMGAMEVVNKAGIKFKVGSGFSDDERVKPPKVGSIITYRYFELSKDKVPRFPTFLRVYEHV